MKHAQTMPEANTDADHNYIVVKICIRLKKIIKFETKTEMGSGYVICQITESIRYSRTKTWCKRM
jgi:hypothetical protein